MSGHPGPDVIASARNERLRLLRSLADRRGRRRLGKFVVEGVRAVEAVLSARPELLEQLLWRHGSEDAEPLAGLLRRVRAAGVPAHPVQPELFDQHSDLTTPQPVLAVCGTAWTPLEQVLGPPDGSPRAVLACLGVQDPGNVGTILRIAHFFACAGVVFPRGAGDPWNPKVVRASSGTLLSHPPARCEDVEQLLAAAAAAGLTPVALTPRGVPLGQARWPARVLLLLGAEGPGLADDVLARTPLQLAIAAGDPAADSLNVAVACGIVVHAWREAVVPGGDA